MNTHILKLFFPFLFILQLTFGSLPIAGAQNISGIDSEKYFTINKILPERPFKKRVTIELNHSISYTELMAWFKRDKPKIIPRMDLDWDISYTDRNKITLKGDFREGQKYSLIFKPGFEIDGKKYKATKSSFVIEPLSYIGFFNEKTVIEKNSKQLLHLNLKNIDRFTVNTLSIPPIYLPYGLDKNRNWKDILEQMNSLQIHKQGNNLPDEFKELQGDLIRDRQIFNFQKSYKEKPFSVPLSSRKNSNKGSIQLIRIESDNPELEAKSSYRLARITDIGITYKRSSSNLLIWLTSIQTGTPLGNQKVYAMDKRFQVFYLGKTNSDGIIIIEPGTLKAMALEKSGNYTVKERYLDLEGVQALIALSHNDISFIEIKKRKEFHAGGPQLLLEKNPEKKQQNLIKANLFTERGIYKPGDAVYFKGTLRQYSDGNILPYSNETPVRIENPRGETVLQTTYKPTEFGTISGRLKLDTHFALGTYTILMGDEDSYVTTRTFQLQEFRAPKHKTQITFETQTKKESGYINLEQETKYLKVKIAGQYYVGGPLKNAQVRWKIFHGKTEFKVSGYDQFQFGSAGTEEELIESSETILDENGNAEFSFPLGSRVKTGKRSLIVVASVIDFDGRVATSKKIYQDKPEYLVGMSRHRQAVKAGMDIPIRFAVIKNEDALKQTGFDRRLKGDISNEKDTGIPGDVPTDVSRDSEPVPLKVEVNILRKGWNYIRKRNERGEIYWNWQELWEKVLSVEHEINNSDNPFIFSNSYGGDYLVKASYSSKGKKYTSGTILKVENGYSSFGRRNKSAPYEKLILFSDKTTYRPGNTAEVKFLPSQKSPTYLVTLEKEGVLDYQLLHSKEKQPSFKIPLTDSHAPNIHVSILGTLPRKEFPLYPSSIDEGAPNFQYGGIKLQVLKESDNLKIEVNKGVDSISQKPSTTGTLQVSVKDKNYRGKSVELAIGIIDEKVLALTNYKTPDLSSLSTIDIPIGVGTADLRLWLSKQTPLKMIWNKPVTGGGGLEKSSASDTTIRSDFNPVAYFNPSVITDSNGNATIEYALPDSITSYRIYIVACDKGNGFGKTELPLIASKDFFIEPGLPRFFSKGDSFEFLVKAINNTEAVSTLNLNSNATTNLNISQQGQDYFLDAMDSTQIRIKGEALSTGIATVDLSGTFEDKTDAVQLEVPVHPGHTIGTDVIIGSFRGDTRLTLPIDQVLEKEFHKNDFFENSKFSLTLSRTPFLRMSGGLTYLLQYPYGCIEQTSSRLLPLVALRGLIDEGHIPEITTATANKYIKAGVDRLFMMQTESGGFGYWPGNKNPHPLGTLYAMAALSIARKNGVDVPEEKLQKSISYLENLLNNDVSLDKTYVAFASYILSLNDAFKPSYRGFLRKVSGKSTEAEMFMLLARNNAGVAKPLKPEKKFWNIFYPQKLDIVAPYFFGEFNARHRYKAVALLAASSLDPDHPLAHRMARELLSGMESEGFWTSTSDTGWALYALGEYYKNQQTSNSPENIKVQWGDYSSIQSLGDQKFKTIDLGIKDKNTKLKLVSEINEPVYYKATLKYPRLDYAESGHSNGFGVSKTIENQSGSGDIHVGDIVKIKVNIDVKDVSYEKPYSYVVIDDPLPSGLVAINSAIKTEEQVDTQEDEKNYWNSEGTYDLVPSFVEFKDDRVLIFKDKMKWSGTYQYTYYARAIMEGDFVLPSTKAQLMYSPHVSGFTPKNRVQISRR